MFGGSMITGKIVAILLSLHAAHSYILLTANLDDVHSLAKQLAASPVGSQLRKLIDRATAVFNKQFSKGDIHMRAHDDTDVEEQNGGGYGNARAPVYIGEASEVWKPNNRGKKSAIKTEATQQEKPKLTTLSSVIKAELDAATSDSSMSSGASLENNDIRVRPQKHHIIRRSQADEEFEVLAKNASFYLKSIKKIFENV